MGKKVIDQAVSIFFSLTDGLSKERQSSKRYLADIKSIFRDQKEAERMVTNHNPLV
ncbi:hypothetical protein LCGC14_3167780, partial [marine sediment metagenome]